MKKKQQTFFSSDLMTISLNRRIPEHPRVVKLIGSVIDYSYRDQTPVLLIMERLKRDLHTALRHKLDFTIR